LAGAAVTLETERIKGSNPWCLWWYIYIQSPASPLLLSPEDEGSTWAHKFSKNLEATLKHLTPKCHKQHMPHWGPTTVQWSREPDALCSAHGHGYTYFNERVRVKVKVTLEQAKKAQSWSRDIALLFL
jgi:hypothetical protein